MMTGAILPFPLGKFGVIYADPPPEFHTRSPKGKGRSPERHYPTMTLAEIKALPVADLAAKNCARFVWLPHTRIFDARDLVEAWSFIGKSIGFAWVKPRKDRQADLLNPERDFPFGNGYGTRANAELCLLATRGNPKRLNADVCDVIEVPRRGHSRKPIEARERIERLYAGPYIELFARWPDPPRLDLLGRRSRGRPVMTDFPAMARFTGPRGFVDWRPSIKSLALLDQVAAVLATYAEQLPLRLRQIFYRLVARFAYENTERAYKRLGELLNSARRAERIAMDHIRDDGFVRHAPSTFVSVETFLAMMREAAEELRLDRQYGQRRRLVVMTRLPAWRRNSPASPTPTVSRCCRQADFRA